ncbi:hypothetical protein DEU56DRAFT_740707 [Suillus clintonianus]|uniref:uncharacterized protein n=1 Tax=Suillus clintonianus TaxID=1904413 RepID=UPI001B860807|nr:uncharacterized protein DEU56DRAFT_740707 [Suillus clintonianus]KAG2130377.1 hypothetical protein DEU56DRAFT_740707 [Suillus clintonianus]
MIQSIADNKLPAQKVESIPPSPSIENPGQVYPKSDPIAAPAGSVPGTGSAQDPSFIIGNPYCLERALEKLDGSIGEVINIIDEEMSSQGASSREVQMKEKLKGWRDDIANLRAGGGKGLQSSIISGAAAEEGGLFVD